MTHCAAATDTPRSEAMRASATLTIVVSRTLMNSPSEAVQATAAGDKRFICRSFCCIYNLCRDGRPSRVRRGATTCDAPAGGSPTPGPRHELLGRPLGALPAGQRGQEQGAAGLGQGQAMRPLVVERLAGDP